MIKPTLIIFSLVCAIVLIGSFILQSTIPQHVSTTAKNVVASVVQSQPTSAYDTCIQSFDATAAKENFKFTYADINLDDIKDGILMYTSDAQCGTGGCQTELCVSNNNEFKHVPFGFAAYEIQIEETISNQMHDLTIKGNSDSKMIWNGSQYILAD